MKYIAIAILLLTAATASAAKEYRCKYLREYTIKIKAEQCPNVLYLKNNKIYDCRCFIVKPQPKVKV